MKTRCPSCQNVFSVPRELCGRTIKCPGCKELVNVTEVTFTRNSFVIVVVSVIISGTLGFGLAMLLNHSKAKKLQATVSALESKVNNFENALIEQREKAADGVASVDKELDRLQRQSQQIEREVQEAWAEKQKVEQELNATRRLEEGNDIVDRSEEKVKWIELGFSKFIGIPPKGEVPTTYLKAVGDFGKPNSVAIVQVLGPYEMIVDLNTGIAKQLVRLKGFTTKGLVDGKFWTGQIWQGDLSEVVHEDNNVQFITPEVAIIGTWSYATALGSQKTIFTAVPLDFIRKGLTKSQFEELLK